MTDWKYLLAGAIISELASIPSFLLFLLYYFQIDVSPFPQTLVWYLLSSSLVNVFATFLGVYIGLLKLPKKPLGSPTKGLGVGLFQLVITLVLVLAYFISTGYSILYPVYQRARILPFFGGQAVGCLTGGVVAGLVIQRKGAPMFCKNCGAQMPRGAKFCGKCGAKLQNRM